MRPERAVARLTTRELRRGGLTLAAATALYMGMEVVSYDMAYPNGVSADQFEMFLDNPAARVLQGVPQALDTAAGFAVWDGGWLLQLVVALWALLATTRVLRGDEDSGRTELALIAPLPAARAVAVTLLVVVALLLLTAAAIGGTLLAYGADPAGSAFFGLAVALVGCTFAGVGAVTSQLVGVRRRAAGLGAAALLVSVLVRMVANSTDDRAWLNWTTPTGWVDVLMPYGDRQPLVLLVALLAPVALMALAVWLRGLRDTGGAVLASSDRRRARLRWLGGATGFAWRSNRAVLVGWIVGLGAYGFVMGSLLDSMAEWLERDKDYQRIFAEMGLEEAFTVAGFLGFMGVVLGLGFALQVAWRLAAARGEEATGRAENLLSRPVTREQWLLGHLMLALVGAALTMVTTALAVYAGVRASGASGADLGDAFAATWNNAAVVLLVAGLAVLTFGLLPRATLVVPVGFAVVGYVVTMLGPLLEWPAWVVDLSPFSHLAYVPAEAFQGQQAAVMALLGVAAAALGTLGFHHRDTAGA